MNVGSKLGLYEFLTMFVSGALILVLLLKILEVPLDKANTVDVFLFSLFSFAVGLIWHRCIEWLRGLWSGGGKKSGRIRIFWGTIFCRNYVRGIEYAKENLVIPMKYFKDGKNRTIVFAIFEKDDNKNHITITTFPKINERSTIDDYYEAYDNVMHSVYKNVINQLEIQEAFLRDMFLPIMFFCFSLLYNRWLGFLPKTFDGDIPIFIPYSSHVFFIPTPCYFISILLLLALFLIARYKTQMNIFRAVWECSGIIEKRKGQGIVAK